MRAESHRRIVRARAARTLSELHARDALAEPERWTWEVLDRLPLWCLLGAERRRHLQKVAGAVLLGPELRLWLERGRLERVGSLIGADVLSRLLEAADAFAARPAVEGDEESDGDVDGGDVDGADDVGTDDARGAAPTRPPRGADDAGAAGDADIEARLLASGAAVLLGTLHESLPLGGLIESLGQPAGTLPPETARLLLAHAEALVVSASGAPARSAA